MTNAIWVGPRVVSLCTDRGGEVLSEPAAGDPGPEHQERGGQHSAQAGGALDLDALLPKDVADRGDADTDAENGDTDRLGEDDLSLSGTYAQPKIRARIEPHRGLRARDLEQPTTSAGVCLLLCKPEIHGGPVGARRRAEVEPEELGAGDPEDGPLGLGDALGI